MSFQNRAVIPTANGVTTLSIPVVGGRQNRCIFRDVRIDNSQNWQVRHWRTITSAYRRSPWFEFYQPSFANFYTTRYDKLSEWNLALLEWIFAALKIKFEISTLENRLENEVVIINNLQPSNFQEAEFVAGLPVYAQVFQERIGFQPNMSVIDLIFNEGNNSRSLIANAFI